MWALVVSISWFLLCKGVLFCFGRGRGEGVGRDEVIEFRVFFFPKLGLFSLKNQTGNQIPSSIYECVGQKSKPEPFYLYLKPKTRSSS